MSEVLTSFTLTEKG